MTLRGQNKPLHCERSEAIQATKEYGLLASLEMTLNPTSQPIAASRRWRRIARPCWIRAFWWIEYHAHLRIERIGYGAAPVLCGQRRAVLYLVLHHARPHAPSESCAPRPWQPTRVSVLNLFAIGSRFDRESARIQFPARAVGESTAFERSRPSKSPARYLVRQSRAAQHQEPVQQYRPKALSGPSKAS